MAKQFSFGRCTVESYKKRGKICLPFLKGYKAVYIDPEYLPFDSVAASIRRYFLKGV